MSDTSNANNAIVAHFSPTNKAKGQGGQWWTTEEMDALRAVLNEQQTELARLRGQLAECEQWEDVPSGTHEINSDIDNGRVTEMNSISVDGNTLTVYEYFAGHSIQAHTTMPNNWRLQRRKESEEAGNDG